MRTVRYIFKVLGFGLLYLVSLSGVGAILLAGLPLAFGDSELVFWIGMYATMIMWPLWAVLVGYAAHQSIGGGAKTGGAVRLAFVLLFAAMSKFALVASARDYDLHIGGVGYLSNAILVIITVCICAAGAHLADWRTKSRKSPEAAETQDTAQGQPNTPPTESN